MITSNKTAIVQYQDNAEKIKLEYNMNDNLISIQIESVIDPTDKKTIYLNNGIFREMINKYYDLTKG